MTSGSSLQHWSSSVSRAPNHADSWTAHLKHLVSSSWRPGEFDFERLLYIPDEANPRTILRRCSRKDCGLVVSLASLCTTCRNEWIAVKDGGTDFDVWLSEPRVRREGTQGCLVHGCQRQHSKLGLCNSHAMSYRIHRNASNQPSYEVQDWLRDSNPQPGKPPVPCIADGCNQDRERRNGLCQRHFVRYDGWTKREKLVRDSETLRLFLEREVEPPMDPDSKATFASFAATPFQSPATANRTGFTPQTFQRRKSSSSLWSSGHHSRGS